MLITLHISISVTDDVEGIGAWYCGRAVWMSGDREVGWLLRLYMGILLPNILMLIQNHQTSFLIILSLHIGFSIVDKGRWESNHEMFTFYWSC